MPARLLAKGDSDYNRGRANPKSNVASNLPPGGSLQGGFLMCRLFSSPIQNGNVGRSPHNGEIVGRAQQNGDGDGAERAQQGDQHA